MVEFELPNPFPEKLIIKISDKIDDVQNSIFENTKKGGGSIIGLLKK